MNENINVTTVITENNSVIKNLGDVYKTQPGMITCNHCEYPFIPQNEHRFTCLKCNISYIVCQRCKKLILKF